MKAKQTKTIELTQKEVEELLCLFINRLLNWNLYCGNEYAKMDQYEKQIIWNLYDKFKASYTQNGAH